MRLAEVAAPVRSEDIYALGACAKSVAQRPAKPVIQADTSIDWSALVEKAAMQAADNEWFLIDLEATLHDLKKMAFIPNKHFRRIYEAQERLHGGASRKN